MKNKLISLINVFGLTAGITVSLLCLMFVEKENSTGRFIPDYQNIYLVTNRGGSHLSYNMMNLIKKNTQARISEIMVLLNRDFIKWVAIAFIIATPVAHLVMEKWLENFAYKTSLNWWIYALAGLIAFLVSLLTVSWQSWRAATRNPVEALRYE